MAEFATRGTAGTALGLSIGALGAQALTGGLGNLLGGLGGCNNGWNRQGVAPVCGDNMPVSRYELGQESKIAELQSQIALRDANTYNDQKLLEVYKYFDGKIEGINQRLCEQAVWNTAQTGTLNCMTGQIAQLYGLTKLVVPNTAICPGWGEVTITPATTTAAAGT